MLLLVPEHAQCQFSVEFWVVAALSCELPVLVVLDETVIRVARERQGVEPQRVHRRHLQQPQAGAGGPQMGEVELDEVVAENEVRPVGEIVKVGQRLMEGAALLGEYDGSFTVSGRSPANAWMRLGVLGDLKIY